MTAALEAATLFVNLWRYLVDAFGQALALRDSRLQVARRNYLECRI